MLILSWKPGKLLGQGSFGRVVFGLNKDTGEVMAVKQVPISDLKASNLLSKLEALDVEIGLLRQLRHKNIVRYIGSEKDNEHHNIFLEYAAGTCFHEGRWVDSRLDREVRQVQGALGPSVCATDP